MTDDTAGEPPVVYISQFDVREPGRSAGKRRLAVHHRRSLLDLAAVGVTKLAWRNSPVEDWHSVHYRRISQAEMMRANAATTRTVRHTLLRHVLDDPAEVFDAVASVITDESRQLPDGRRLHQLAPTEVQYGIFRDEVTAVCRDWSVRVARHGLPTVLLALAGEAGRGSSRRWWLGPDWPAVVAEFVARLEDPRRWEDEMQATWVRTTERPADLPEPGRLGQLLLQGPDRLQPAWATYCLRAGVGSIIPRGWEQPPLAYQQLAEARGDG